MCIAAVVVTHKFNMASYLPEAGNSNGSNTDMCSMWLGHLLAAWALFLSFQIDHRSRTLTISPTASNTSCLLGFEHDYNYHTAKLRESFPCFLELLNKQRPQISATLEARKI